MVSMFTLAADAMVMAMKVDAAVAAAVSAAAIVQIQRVSATVVATNP